MKPRVIAPVIQRKRLGDEDSDALTYWLTQPIEARILEVEVLRRMWIDRFGDPDRPMERSVIRRRLGDED